MVDGPEFLDRMWDFFEYMGLGFAPTPSSMGKLMQFYVWSEHKLHRHTALPLGCEEYIRRYSPGPISFTTDSSTSYDKTHLGDMSSAYLSRFQVVPDATAVFANSADVECYSTYVARCTVTIHSELPLGIFPIKFGSRSNYPTLKGEYKNVHLWKGQVERLREQGCTVQVHSGWGWENLTGDPGYWARYAYQKRVDADTEDIASKVKGCSVAGMGRHSMSREHYLLVVEGRQSDGDQEWLLDGEPVNIYIHKEYDRYSALMTHWNKYCINDTNMAVYDYALPFAEQGRLLMIDTDSIMVTEGSDTARLVKIPKSEAVCQPGDWYWRLLTEVEIVGSRSFRSRELNRLPGVKNEFRLFLSSSNGDSAGASSRSA